MVILDDNYYIEQAENLISGLKEYQEELSLVRLKLKELSEDRTCSTEEFIKYYEEEFELLMLLSGAYHDILKLLGNIKNKENIFIVNRLTKETTKLFKPLAIE